MPAPSVILASPAEVLALKLSLWETRAKYAKGAARKAECAHAIHDLNARIARLS